MVLNLWFGHVKIENENSKNPVDPAPSQHKPNQDAVIAPVLGADPGVITSFTTTTDNNMAAIGGGGGGGGGGPQSIPQRTPTHHACEGYQGIYHIEKGDIGGAAGTIFFQFVIGQLVYAEMYNLKPWVFFNNVSYVIYDPLVHGRGPGVDFTMQGGMNVSYVQRPNGHWRDAIPGPLVTSGLYSNDFHFDGMGVWEDYFEPVSDFVPGDESCRNKPLVTMDLYLVTPGIHGFAPWAPKCWRYQYLPDYITKPHIPLSEWLEPQRHMAHTTLTKYIRFVPAIQESAQQVNPSCSRTDPSNSCLGIHIRQSDKAAGRRQLETDEFLPYVQAFLQAGGQWVYLATDSGRVMDHVQQVWPNDVTNRIRTMGANVVRSNDDKAVFDIASHHRTNTEIFIEILALSQCQFMVHGLSAVTETSIWINVDLHYTSVNLEDPDHLEPEIFGTLVDKILHKGANASQLLLDRRDATTNWWNTNKTINKNDNSNKAAGNDSDATGQKIPTHEACPPEAGLQGILHIAHVGTEAAAGTAFFTSILNQLIYAEKYNLKPWIHLVNDSSYIYDDTVHGVGSEWTIETSNHSIEAGVAHYIPGDGTTVYPDQPVKTTLSHAENSTVSFLGSGVWSNYFEPVSDFVPGDKSCANLPVISIDSKLVIPGLNSWCPWSVKAWRYDNVPDGLWQPDTTVLRDWVEPMRRKGHDIVKKYYRFQPYIERRAAEVNPRNQETDLPCLAVHIRNSDKQGQFRSKFPPTRFREYMQAFARAGGRTIYVATDSHRILEYIEQHFPASLRQMIRTQGPYVVRSTKKWPIHELEKHHRTNSEVLVDIVAMSKCELLLHGNSAVSEAAIYLNLNLHRQSVNWEDKQHMSINEFEEMSRKVLVAAVGANLTRLSETPPASLLMDGNNEMVASDGADTPKQRMHNVTIVHGSNRVCRKNAIVYLAQKRHSTYDRDSYGILMNSLDLMYKNYLSLGDHRQNADIIIFHTSDFDNHDLDTFETRFGSEFRELIYLVDLSNSPYWQRPWWHKLDDPTSWYAFPLFSEGYRRMMHWFAIDIWHFFSDYAQITGCIYEYIMRFDEDSFLHSPVEYDVFDFMKSRDYNYGFRLCAYEMQVTQRIWKLWNKASKGGPPPIRDVDLEMCGVYNNFFVAKLAFFQSAEVSRFLKFVDRQGMIYRRRLGDLMIHSMAIYAFSPPENIHRFLDFTYEHGTVDQKTGCLVWGGIQAGYNDKMADQTLETFYQTKVLSKGCTANRTILSQQSLSPTYTHLPPGFTGKLALKTIMAGRVELPGKSILSG
jgi:hypothetical protein